VSDSTLADPKRRIAALPSAKWALDHDGLEWNSFVVIAAALFAAHNESPLRKDHAL